jgi:hypothetical protein
MSPAYLKSSSANNTLEHVRQAHCEANNQQWASYANCSKKMQKFSVALAHFHLFVLMLCAQGAKMRLLLV